jgi:multiple sugar transport system permease protein
MFRPTLENIRAEYNGVALADLVRNSLIIASVSAALSTIIGAAAAYGITRSSARWASNLFWLVLSSRMAPLTVFTVPLFFMFAYTGMRGTYAAVILAHTVANLSLSLWFLWRAFGRIPRSLEIAAQIDGATPFRAALSTTWRLSLPAIATCYFLCFVLSWNEFTFASLVSAADTRPITASLPAFMAQGSSQWGAFAAVASLSAFPTLILAALIVRLFRANPANHQSLEGAAIG